MRHLVAQLRKQVATSATCLCIVDLDHQMSGFLRRKGALKCPDCGKRVFSGRITGRFQDANKDHLIDGKAELRAVGMDVAKILQAMLRVDGWRSGYMSLEHTSQILRTRDKHVELLERLDP